MNSRTNFFGPLLTQYWTKKLAQETISVPSPLVRRIIAAIALSRGVFQGMVHHGSRVGWRKRMKLRMMVLMSGLHRSSEWDTVASTLDEGKQDGYLDQHVEWHDDLYMPLHYAADVGDLDVVEELIKKYNVNVEITTGFYERTPLHLAASGGHLDVVMYLVRMGANWNTMDNTEANVLHYAAFGIQGEQNMDVFNRRGKCGP
jgi:Ankyrin repeats (3 copies)